MTAYEQLVEAADGFIENSLNVQGDESKVRHTPLFCSFAQVGYELVHDNELGRLMVVEWEQEADGDSWSGAYLEVWLEEMAKITSSDHSGETVSRLASLISERIELRLIAESEADA